MALVPANRTPQNARTKRVTRPEYYNPYASGGIGVVPRRGFDIRTRAFIDDCARNPVRGMAAWAGSAPLRMLDVLVRTHPMGQMALSNDLALAFLPDSTRIVAVENADDKQSNSEGTAVLDALWESLPSDLGGLIGLQNTIGHHASTFGMACIEAVAQRGVGVIDCPDFSPVSVRWADNNKGRELQQLIGSKWEPMPATGPDATVFAVPYRGSRENPYGVPRLGAFLTEGLADIYDQRNLADVMRAIAWPHLAFEFPVEQTIKFALENPDVLLVEGEADLTPLQYAVMVFEAFVAKIETLKADDSFTLPSGAKANVLNAGEGMAGAMTVLEMRRLRLCQSLDHLPSLLGITDGGTLAYSSTQWKQYASKLEALRGFTNGILRRIANLHLRTLGLPLIARVDTEPIQTTDRLNEAQARAVEIRNALTLVDRGYQSDDDAATQLTGGDVVDPARAQAAHEAALSGKAAPSGSDTTAKDANAEKNPPGGKTI